MKEKQLWYRLTHWEQWHYNAKYVLLAPVWLWYSLRAWSFYFFVPANPTLTFGGFEGGPKKEIYKQLPPQRYPKTTYIDPAWAFEKVECAIAAGEFIFPLAVKPNIGMMGLMFRKINNRDELALYHQTITVEYIVQELVWHPLEVSVFYYRFPDQQKGAITGFVRKEALEVVGTGRATLKELMTTLEGRPGYNKEEWLQKHKDQLQDVIPEGKTYKLSWVANLSRGARLVSLEQEKDETLLQVFDGLSHAAKHFYYGRYDIKCASVDDLKKGKNFSILEFNGAGAEPHHMYGAGNNLLQAFKIIIQHWQVLFSIARYNRQQGIKYPSLWQGVSFTKRANRHFKKLRQLDATMPVFH
jgi:hypothetical protein